MSEDDVKPGATHLLSSPRSSRPANALPQHAHYSGLPLTSFPRMALCRAPLWEGGFGAVGGTGCLENCWPVEGKVSRVLPGLALAWVSGTGVQGLDGGAEGQQRGFCTPSAVL